MVVLVLKDVVVVAGHGGSVEVGNVPGGKLVGKKVVGGKSIVDVVLGHGPTPPPGRGQSKWKVVVVLDGTEVVVAVHPKAARNGANTWRTRLFGPRSAWA
jgi:hypothetical protein